MMAEIKFTVSQKEIIDFGPNLPPIFLLIPKGLKTRGMTDPQPLGVVEWWHDPATGDWHYKQVVEDLCEKSFDNMLKDIIAIKNEANA